MRKGKWAILGGVLVAVSFTGCAASGVGVGPNIDHTVVYTVTSDAPMAGMITYSVGKVAQEQATDAALPWSKTLTMGGAVPFDRPTMILLAQSGKGATSISCEITLDGAVVAKQTSTGPYATVTCNELK